MAILKAQISVLLDINLVNRLDEIAKAKGVNRSALINNAVRDYIEKEELVIKQGKNKVIKTN